MNATGRTCAFAILVLGCLELLSPRGWAEEKPESEENPQSKETPESAEKPKSEEQLLERPLEELLDTEVTTPSRRPQEVREVPVTTYVVTEEDFRTYGYRDLKDVLRNLPGIEYVYPHSHLFGGQRGFSSFWELTKLLIDGRESNILSTDAIFLVNQFPLSGVKRVEVVQGPASVLYGPEAFSGVINIITKNAENSSTGNEFRGIVGGGYMSSRDVNGAYYSVAQKGPLALAMGGYVDGYRGPDYTNFVKTPYYTEVNRDIRTFLLEHGNPYRDDGRNYQFNIDLSYSPNSRINVQVGALYWREENQNGIENPVLSYTNVDVIGEQTHFFLSGQYKFATLPLRSTLSYHLILDNFWARFQNAVPDPSETPPLPPLLAAFNFEGNKLNVVNLQVDYFPSFIDNYLLAGIGLRDTWLPEPRFTGISPTDVTPGQPVSLVGRYLFPPPGYFNNLQPFLRQNRLYLYAQDQQSFWKENIQITAGLRYDHNNVYGNIWNVRGGVVVRPFANYTIRGAFGQGFREPTIFELADNPGLVPARMNSWEVSLLFTPVRNLSGQVAYFQNYASKLIVLGRGIGARGGPPANIGQKRVAGVETLIRYKIGPFGGDLWHSYEYPFDDRPLLGTARNKLGFGGYYAFREHLSLSLRAKYTNRALGPALDSQGNEIVIDVPEYFTLDLNAMARNLAFAGVHWDLSFLITNILGKKNYYVNTVGPNPFRYLADGREYFGNVTIHF